MSPEFMKRAIALALENVRSGNGGPFAAVIVKEDRIIAEGTNRVTLTNDPTAHAEVVAIREACRALADFQLRGCDLLGAPRANFLRRNRRRCRRRRIRRCFYL